MNKMFKISAVAASLLVSGILVGCGSSKSGNSGNPEFSAVPKVVMLTDDYVSGATVFGLGSKTRAVGNNQNDSKDDLANKNISLIEQPTTNDIKAKPFIDPETKKPIAGKYKFEDISTATQVASNGGFLDLNKDGKQDVNEPNALSMAAYIDSSMARANDEVIYVNPFTTLAALTSLNGKDVAKVLGLDNINIDTTVDDLKVRKAVAYANAILAKAQYYDKNTNVSNQPSNDNNKEDKIIIPNSYSNNLEKIVEDVKETLKNNQGDIASAIATLTSNDKYRTVNTLKDVNDLILSELMKYTTKEDSKKEETSTTDIKPETDKIIIPN